MSVAWPDLEIRKGAEPSRRHVGTLARAAVAGPGGVKLGLPYRARTRGEQSISSEPPLTAAQRPGLSFAGDSTTEREVRKANRISDSAPLQVLFIGNSFTARNDLRTHWNAGEA